MRFKNIAINFNDNDWIEWGDNTNVSFVIEPNNELINIVNDMRIKLGYELPNDDNDIYYDFYLGCDLLSKKVELEAVVLNGDDSRIEYEINLTDDENEYLYIFSQETLIEDCDWYGYFAGSAYDTVEYCIFEANVTEGDIAYEIRIEDRVVIPLEIVKVIRRSDCELLYDLADKEVLLIGESEFKADCSAEFITDKDSYLVWFRDRGM